MQHKNISYQNSSYRIISHPLLMPTDTLLRLGVVESNQDIQNYEHHSDALLNRLQATIAEGILENPQLADTIGTALQLPEQAFFETDEVDVLIDFIMESDQMIGVLSDLQKHWQNLDDADVEELNQVSIAVSEESQRAIDVEKGKAYLKMELAEYLEILSMYLED